MTRLQYFSAPVASVSLALSIVAMPQQCLAWSSGGAPSEAVVVLFSVWADRCKTENVALAPSITEAFDGWRERNRRHVDQAQRDKARYEGAVAELMKDYAEPKYRETFGRIGCRLLGETLRSPAFDLDENWFESNFGFLRTGKMSPLLLSLTTLTLKEQCVAKVPSLKTLVDDAYMRWRSQNAALVASSEADPDWGELKIAFPGIIWYRNLTEYRSARYFEDLCPKALGQLPVARSAIFPATKLAGKEESTGENED